MNKVHENGGFAVEITEESIHALNEYRKEHNQRAYSDEMGMDKIEQSLVLKFPKDGGSATFMDRSYSHYPKISFQEFKDRVSLTHHKNDIDDMDLWIEETRKLNLNEDELESRIGYCNFGLYNKLPGKYSRGKARKLLTKWNKEPYELAHPGFGEPQECTLNIVNLITDEGHTLSVKTSYIEPKLENMITITRDQLKEIHDIACSEWQGKITKIAQDQPFGDIVLGDGAINQMFLAATQSQLPVLERIFGKQNQMKIDMEKNQITNSKGQSFHLFDQYSGTFTQSRQFDDLILIDESVFNVEIIIRSGCRYIQITERK